MPSPRDRFLSMLGVKMAPTLPPLSPEDQAGMDTRATEVQAGWSPMKRRLLSAVEGVGDYAEGLFADPTGPMGSTAHGAGMLTAAALPFGPKGIPGMFSRVERLAEKLPAAIHPNKLASILKNSTSSEELAWRKVPELIQEAGGKPIQKERFINHLESNPLDVKVTRLGQTAADLQAERARYGQVYNEYFRNNPHADPHVNQPDIEQARTRLTELEQRVNSDGNGTQWGGGRYEMPGATNYREDLIQLASRPQLKDYPSRDAYDAAVAKADSTAEPFYDHHYPDHPNLVVAVRHNERRLPLDKLPEGYRVEHGTDERFNNALWVDGPNGYMGPSVRTEAGPYDMAYDTAANEAVQKAAAKDLGPKGRMLENVQSVWEQKGAHAGYTDDANLQGFIPEDAARQAHVQLDQLTGQLEQQFSRYIDSGEIATLDPSDVPEYLVNRFIHSGDPEAQAAAQRIQEARVAYDNALDIIYRGGGAVPNMPFKGRSVPPTLAIRQQLMDVAHNAPDTQWIGIAPSSELNARGEGIDPEFQDKMLPNILEKALRDAAGPPIPAKDALWGRMQQTPLFERTASVLPRQDVDTHIGSVGRILDYPRGEWEQGEELATHWPKLRVAGNPQKDPDLHALAEMVRATNPSALQPQEVKAPIARLTPELLAHLRAKGFPLLAILAMFSGSPDAPVDSPPGP